MRKHNTGLLAFELDFCLVLQNGSQGHDILGESTGLGLEKY